MCTRKQNATPPARDERRLSGVWRGVMVRLYILLLPSYTKKKKSVKSLLFLTQKGAEECLKFREGWRYQRERSYTNAKHSNSATWLCGFQRYTQGQ
ncbi:hypothetical protein NQZ68_007793 [Dissostichus eleginoides]|nr:hypothetical protein NQZ68_007793 [Dissostichus eleginoides]